MFLVNFAQVSSFCNFVSTLKILTTNPSILDTRRKAVASSPELTSLCPRIQSLYVEYMARLLICQARHLLRRGGRKLFRAVSLALDLVYRTNRMG